MSFNGNVAEIASITSIDSPKIVDEFYDQYTPEQELLMTNSPVQIEREDKIEAKIRENEKDLHL